MDDLRVMFSVCLESPVESAPGRAGAEEGCFDSGREATAGSAAAGLQREPAGFGSQIYVFINGKQEL